MSQLTYSSYLQLDKILNAQSMQGEESDEMLFIIVHQTYELWFKQLLWESIRLGQHWQNARISEAGSTLVRMLKILKTMVAQVDVLETMTPLSFLSFRQLLSSASGFQSLQFRLFEMRLGARDARKLPAFTQSTEQKQLEAAWYEPSLFDQFLHFLSRSGFSVPESALQRDVTQTLEANLEVQELLLQIYRTQPTFRHFCESLVDLDEGVQEWRYRHVKMVERTIGFKVGTGGSSGVDYLRTTLFRPAFPDLWQIRQSF